MRCNKYCGENALMIGNRATPTAARGSQTGFSRGLSRRKTATKRMASEIWTDSNEGILTLMEGDCVDG